MIDNLLHSYKYLYKQAKQLILNTRCVAVDEDRVALMIGGKGSFGGLYKAIEVYLTYGVKGKIYHENEILK